MGRWTALDFKETKGHEKVSEIYNTFQINSALDFLC